MCCVGLELMIVAEVRVQDLDTNVPYYSLRTTSTKGAKNCLLDLAILVCRKTLVGFT